MDDGSALAIIFGVSEAIIALFLIAIGTSLPELATSIVAVRRGEGDIVTGNVVGTNIFNILAVIGICALISPIYEDKIDMLDKMVMLGLTFVITLVMWLRGTLNRTEGVMLVVGYRIYTGVRYCQDQGLI